MCFRPCLHVVAIYQGVVVLPPGPSGCSVARHFVVVIRVEIIRRNKALTPELRISPACRVLYTSGARAESPIY